MNYYNFIVGLEGNKISVAKLQSTDGTAEGTELLDADGLSTHPSIKYFISKEGIELDPPSHKIPFSYLYNFTGTEGCSLVQNIFTADSHDLTFLPDNVKSLYEPQVTSNKIVFVTPANSTVTLTDRPGRFIDYSNPRDGSVGEDYDFDNLVVPCDEWIKEKNCNFDIVMGLRPECDNFSFYIRISKSIRDQCYCADMVPALPEIECKKIDLDSFKLENTKQEIRQRSRKNEKVSECTTSKTECYETLNLSFKLKSQGNVGGDVEISGRIGAPSGSTIVEGPGIGVGLLEDALRAGVDSVIPNPHLIANRLVNIIRVGGFSLGLADNSSSLTELTNAAGSVAKLVKDPVNVTLDYVFNLLNQQLSDTLGDYVENVSEEINRLISECKKTSKGAVECGDCLESKFKEEFNNKNSPMRKNINKIIRASKLDPCC